MDRNHSIRYLEGFYGNGGSMLFKADEQWLSFPYRLVRSHFGIRIDRRVVPVQSGVKHREKIDGNTRTGSHTVQRGTKIAHDIGQQYDLEYFKIIRDPRDRPDTCAGVQQ